MFKVKELSFAVWSCERQLILDSMDIVDLSDIDKAIENAAVLEEKRSNAAAIEQKKEEETEAVEEASDNEENTGEDV